MKNTIKLILATASVALLTACGGGGGGGGGSGSGGSDEISKPVVTFYKNFNLAGSLITSTLQTCNASANQVEIAFFNFDPVTSGLTRTSFMIDGNLTLPNAGSCSITGMTGNISSVRLSRGGERVYEITGINIDANFLTTGWQNFWRALNNASQTIQASSPNPSTIVTCTDSSNVIKTLGMTQQGDISDFITACTR